MRGEFTKKKKILKIPENYTLNKSKFDPLRNHKIQLLKKSGM